MRSFCSGIVCANYTPARLGAYLARGSGEDRQVAQLADVVDGVVGGDGARLRLVLRGLDRLIRERAAPDRRHAQRFRAFNVGAKAVTDHRRLCCRCPELLERDLEDARMWLHVADVAGDDGGLEELLEAEVAHLFVEARAAVAAVGDGGDADAAIEQPTERRKDVGEQLAAEEGAAEVPGFPELCALVGRQVDIVPSRDAPAELRVAGVTQSPWKARLVSSSTAKRMSRPR